MFNIRLANKDDIKKVFDLSNDDVVRQNSINKGKINWENHTKWFSDRIKNTEEPFYIIEDEKGNFIAQVRFNKEDEGFVISISIQKEFRGKGIAGHLLNMAVEDMRLKGISPLYLVADIKGFYEKYGWEYLCNAQSDGEDHESSLYIHR